MKRITLVAALSALVSMSLAQNLVNNYSFETYSSCPTSSSQIAYATPWNASMNSPEYLNSCSSSIYSDVPTSYFGFQNAATGQAYAGGLFYGSFAGSYLANLREHLYVTLSSPLSVGTTYYISFKVNLVDNSEYAVNRMGVQFCSSYNASFGMNNTAHVYSTAVVSDKVNWTTVVGSFVPSVAYNALMVGNFFDDANTTVTFVGSSTDIGYNAYYFVDDVVVTTTPIVLPMDWVHVGADVNGRVATLEWEFSGDDMASFMVEHSDDGYAFHEAARSVPGVSGQRQYSAPDTMTSHQATSFYRIRAIGHNGENYVSPVIEAKRYEAGIDFLLAYPSPVGQGSPLTIEYNSTTGQASTLQFISIDGKLVKEVALEGGAAGHQSVEVSVADLAPGSYVLKAGALTRKLVVVED